MIQKRLEEINRTGLSLDLGRIIDDAFDTYKKIAINAGLGYLIMVIVMSAITFGVLSIFFVASEIFDKIADLKGLEVLPLDYFMGIMSFSLVSTVLLTPFLAGILKMCKTADDTANTNLNDLFYYYKAPYFLNLITLSFITQLLIIGIQYIFSYVVTIPFVGGLLEYTLYFLFILSIPLVIFGDLKPLVALETSAKLSLKNPFVFIGGMVIAYIFAAIGIIALCIGVFFTLPFVEAMRYTFYKHSIGFEEEAKEWEQIGTVEQ